MGGLIHEGAYIRGAYIRRSTVLLYFVLFPQAIEKKNDNNWQVTVS